MFSKETYLLFINEIEDEMFKARTLGLFRTAKKLHRALNEARSEMFEAIPDNTVHAEFKIGPVSKQ